MRARMRCMRRVPALACVACVAFRPLACPFGWLYRRRGVGFSRVSKPAGPIKCNWPACGCVFQGHRCSQGPRRVNTLVSNQWQTQWRGWACRPWLCVHRGPRFRRAMRLGRSSHALGAAMRCGADGSRSRRWSARACARAHARLSARFPSPERGCAAASCAGHACKRRRQPAADAGREWRMMHACGWLKVPVEARAQAPATSRPLCRKRRRRLDPRARPEFRVQMGAAERRTRCAAAAANNGPKMGGRTCSACDNARARLQGMVRAALFRLLVGWRAVGVHIRGGGMGAAASARVLRRAAYANQH